MSSSRSCLGTPVVAVIDDDLSMRESLELLFRSTGWRAAIFSSVVGFQSARRVTPPSCLVLDASLDDLESLDLVEVFGVEPSAAPVVFITGHDHVPAAVRSRKLTHVECLKKPFASDDLLRAILVAIELSCPLVRAEESSSAAQETSGTLVPKVNRKMEP